MANVPRIISTFDKRRHPLLTIILCCSRDQREYLSVYSREQFSLYQTNKWKLWRTADGKLVVNLQFRPEDEGSPVISKSPSNREAVLSIPRRVFGESFRRSVVLSPSRVNQGKFERELTRKRNVALRDREIKRKVKEAETRSPIEQD